MVLIAGLLAAGVPLRGRLIEERRAAGLGETEISRLPPIGAASVLLLGGFRGIAVDVLWLRAITLHEKRQYVEERGLIELITELQPHFITVWAFQALVIVYDISVQEPTLAGQWLWIRDGIAFMKKGIERNPESLELYFYLGYIYRDKVAQNPYFEDAMERDLGVNNFEEAAAAFDRARKLKGGRSFPFALRVVDDGVFYAYLARAQQILRRAELSEDLQFSPETLARARVFTEKCREEIPGLQKRWPDDAVFETLPVRVDLVPFDGHVSQINRTLAQGDYSDEAISRARKVLDKALAEMDNCRPKHPEARFDWVFQNKTVDAWTRIPLAVVRHVGERMNGSDAGPVERRRCLHLLQAAEKELQRAPAWVSVHADLQSLGTAVRAGIRALSRNEGTPDAPAPDDVSP